MMLPEAHSFLENKEIANIIVDYICRLNLQSPWNLKSKYKCLVESVIWDLIVFHMCVLSIILYTIKL